MTVAIPLIIRWLPDLLDAATTHLTIVSVLLALQASILVHRGRRKWTEIYSSGWLSTLPISRRETTRMIALRSFLGPLLLLVLLTIVVVLQGRIEPLSDEAKLLLPGSAIATVVGAVLGWYSPRRDTGHFRPVSVYPPNSGTVAAPTFAGLSHWATLQTKVWLQPRSLARLLLPAMLALPMDISANVAVGVITLWALALYLLVLLRAIAHVARAGAEWLRPTPLTFYRFAWAMARHPLFKQLQWTVTAAGLLIALGCKPVVAMRVAEGWFALVSVTSGLALAHAYHSRSFRVKLVVSICGLAMVERIREHAALPCALLISAWQFRKAARA